MAGHQKEKAISDEVHQNQILRELYLKELRTQKLYTQYHVNPLRKVHTIARKPMSWHDNLEEPADARFLNLIHHAAQGPRKKYPETQTEGQEIGWDSEPLVSGSPLLGRSGVIQRWLRKQSLEPDAWTFLATM
uniref:Cilia and flagella associated protein 144 n=1 Tax=Bos mutus grunniens TaxID=30521 RepID=A0A8B9XDS6_BOSMU